MIFMIVLPVAQTHRGTALASEELEAKAGLHLSPNRIPSRGESLSECIAMPQGCFVCDVTHGTRSPSMSVSLPRQPAHAAADDFGQGGASR
jgi:hypothetical protein